MIGKCIMTSLSSDSRSPGTNSSSNGGDVVANNNHLPQDVPAPDIVPSRTKMRDRPAVGNGDVAGRPARSSQDDQYIQHRDAADTHRQQQPCRQASEQQPGMCRLETLRTASARSQIESPTQSGGAMSNARIASAVSPSTIGSCGPGRSVESSVSAAGGGTSSTTRHHQSSVVERDATRRDMTDSGSPFGAAVSSTVVELEDPYAELERILEKVQLDNLLCVRKDGPAGFDPRVKIGLAYGLI
uniref:Uncharacterized protein n=1 Tax=Anopheles maculatus TaxID=74869 RepID=A0A182T521_9DIPT